MRGNSGTSSAMIDNIWGCANIIWELAEQDLERERDVQISYLTLSYLKNMMIFL